MNRINKDPFLTILRREARKHCVACAIAFAGLISSRYAGLSVAGSDAILLAPSPVGLVADFVTAVLMLTCLRLLYGIPLWFAPPAIRRVGTYVVFTLVFGTLFTLRSQQALGVRVEQGGVRVFYPYPSASMFIPATELSKSLLRETSVVSIVEIHGASVRFIPAFHFDSSGQARLRILFHALTTASVRGA